MNLFYADVQKLDKLCMDCKREKTVELKDSLFEDYCFASLSSMHETSRTLIQKAQDMGLGDAFPFARLQHIEGVVRLHQKACAQVSKDI